MSDGSVGEAADGSSGVGPSDVDSLVLIETNEQGEAEHLVRFDDGDLEAARAELEARFETLEGGAHPLAGAFEALDRRDWPRFFASVAPELSGEDHRHAGAGSLSHPSALVESLRATVETAPDARLEVDHLRTAPGRISLAQLAWRGTRDGSAYENVIVGVLQHDAWNRLVRIECWDLEQLDEALARFEASRGVGAKEAVAEPSETEALSSLESDASSEPDETPEPGSVATPDHPLIAPNEATRTCDELWRLWQAEDWGGIEALHVEGCMLDDRRSIPGAGRPKKAVDELRRRRLRAPKPPERRLLATFVGRLSLEHLAWRSRLEDAIFEIELLRVIEVDDEGRIAAVVDFDVEDRVAAIEELMERWSWWTEDGYPTGVRLARCWNTHDPSALREALHPDLVFHDRRRTGVGRIADVEEYVAFAEAMWGLSPDVRLEPVSTARFAPGVILGVTRRAGTDGDGGDHEAYMLSLTAVRDGRTALMELFEIEDLEVAVARFEELTQQEADA